MATVCPEERNGSSTFSGKHGQRVENFLEEFQVLENGDWGIQETVVGHQKALGKGKDRLRADLILEKVDLEFPEILMVYPLHHHYHYPIQS